MWAGVFLLVWVFAPAAPVWGQRAATGRAGSSSDVTIVDAGDTVKLANGRIALTIAKKNANILQAVFDGVDLLDGGVYWTVYGDTPGKPKTQSRGLPSVYTIKQDPQHNGGEMGEVELTFPYTGQADAEPLDISIRYMLQRGDSGIYCWTTVTHRPGYPEFNIEIALVTLKLRPDLFDHLTVDARRNRQMITGEDWLHGQPVNLMEARRMTTGVHAGEVEHKYDYSAMFSETPAYGWTSTKGKVGVWMVNPSLEYINGAPTKIELTGHVDIKDSLPANPTLLLDWHGSHYGGVPISIGPHEDWKKVVGPFVIYCNRGASPDAMWKNALDRAAREQKAWPYAWAEEPGYPHAEQRGAVHGRLMVNDPQQPKANAAHAWVGLAQAPYMGVDLNRKPYLIGWEQDGKNYEYWARADGTGAFTIANARPGKYVLSAFTNGILGEFSKADVSVVEGKSVDLGTLHWTPVRYGKQVWEIGVPDRSAAEFRHGDHYWTWGLYDLYPMEFPSGVNFVVGKSDWSKDWNYVQPPRLGADGKWTGTRWRITFNMRDVEPGKAMLRLAICGSRGNSLDVSVNGTGIGSSGALPNSGVMHRDGIRSVETEVDLPFDMSLLARGENHIDITTQAQDWTEGVLYDYLRMEIAGAKTEGTSGR